MSPAIRVQMLSCDFYRWGQRVVALDKINLDIPSGEWVMVVGPNGSGKTTLLNVLCRRIRSYAGYVEVCGIPLAKLSQKQRAACICHVCQNPILGTAPALTVYENMLVADRVARDDGTNTRGLWRKYGALLGRFNLESHLQRPAAALSGGERQVLALLIAELSKAPIVLLDEAFSAIDEKNMKSCLAVLRSLYAQGRTLLQITHDLEFATAVGDRTIAFSEGLLICDLRGEARSIDRLRSLMLRDDRLALIASQNPD